MVSDNVSDNLYQIKDVPLGSARDGGHTELISDVKQCWPIDR